MFPFCDLSQMKTVFEQISFIPQGTESSLSKSCHSGLFTSRNLFVLKISDKVAAVAAIITTTAQKLEAGLNFRTKDLLLPLQSDLNEVRSFNRKWQVTNLTRNTFSYAILLCNSANTDPMLLVIICDRQCGAMLWCILTD